MVGQPVGLVTAPFELVVAPKRGALAHRQNGRLRIYRLVAFVASANSAAMRSYARLTGGVQDWLDGEGLLVCLPPVAGAGADVGVGKRRHKALPTPDDPASSRNASPGVTPVIACWESFSKVQERRQWAADISAWGSPALFAMLAKVQTAMGWP